MNNHAPICKEFSAFSLGGRTFSEQPCSDVAGYDRIQIPDRHGHQNLVYR